MVQKVINPLERKILFKSKSLKKQKCHRVDFLNLNLYHQRLQWVIIRLLIVI